jgi:ligand-binding sensor domain-containing protein/signal transduction histidine kinase/DNA-binding response OmpR family regulator
LIYQLIAPMKNLLLQLCFWLFPALAFTQDSFRYYNYSTQQGLPTNTFEYIRQDSYGYIWLASFDGLFRWDGHSFKQYLSNIVYTVFEDSKGLIWVGSLNGLSVYDPENDRFRFMKLKGGDKSIPVNAIVEDRNHQLWLGTSLGLCTFDPSDEKERWFDNVSDIIFCMTIDKNQNLWIGTINGGVQKFSTENYIHLVLPLPEPKPGKKGFTKINSLLAASDGAIWVGTERAGLFVLNSDGTVKKIYNRFSATSDGRPSLVRTLYEDSGGTVWIGVVRDVLYYISKGMDNPMPVSETALNNEKDQLHSVNAVTEDRYGNTWFATSERGLFYTNKYKNRFTTIRSGAGKGQIPGGITTFLELDDKSVWIATNGAGIYKWDDATRTASRLPDPLIATDAINDMKRIGDQVWVATWGNGIRVLNENGTQVNNYRAEPGNENALLSNDIKSILPDDSLIWIGTHGEGLAIFNRKTGRITNHKNSSGYPFNLKAPAWINHLYKDSQRRLWISTYSGLFRWDGRALKQFLYSEDTASLGNNAVNMVTESADGSIWVVHEAGVDRFTDGTESFERIAERLNLPPVMKSIKADGPWLWISSNTGILRLNSQNLDTKWVQESDGLSPDMYQRTCFISSSGRLFAAGAKGFAYFQTSGLGEIAIPMDFYFTELDHIESKENLFLFYKDSVQLSHRQSIFSVSYACPDFYAPANIRFRYKIEGLGADWIEAGDQRKLLFTNLPTGNYVLKVQVRNHAGRWVDASKNLHIEKLPPWWMTWWFHTLVAIFIVGAIAGFYSVRMAAIKKRNRLLREEIARHTASLREKNDELMEQRDEILQQNETIESANAELRRQTNRILQQQQQLVEHNAKLSGTVEELQSLHRAKNYLYTILAHDLKNPVLAQSELAAYLLDNLREMNKTELTTYLHSIQRSSVALYELLLNLLNWAQMESDQLKPDRTDLALADLISENISLLSSQFRNKNISVEVKIENDLAIHADRNMTNTIIRNILSNACKFSNYNGSIEIEAKQVEEKVFVSFKDYGSGMTSEQQTRLFEFDKRMPGTGTAGEKGIGLGLLVAQSFIKVNDGEILVSSDEGKGSRFTLVFPIAIDTPAATTYAPATTVHLPPSDIDTLTEQDRVRVFGKKVLLVEDDMEVRECLKLMLSGLFEIFEAPNGETALHQIDHILPDVVITDLLMPGMGGLQFCRELRNKPGTSYIPIIILTGQTEEQLKQESYSSGADIHLEKPVKQEFLIQVISSQILKQEKQREAIMGMMMGEMALPALGSGLNKSDEEFLIRLVDLIEQHLSDPQFDARVISRSLGVSRTVLYSKIKHLTGSTVHEFIKSIRLRKSVRLLRESRMSITQIAFEVGFSSRSYFDRCFVKQFKVPPREYVNSLRGRIPKNSGPGKG